MKTKRKVAKYHLLCEELAAEIILSSPDLRAKVGRSDKVDPIIIMIDDGEFKNTVVAIEDLTIDDNGCATFASTIQRIPFGDKDKIDYFTLNNIDLDFKNLMNDIVSDIIMSTME